jgi:organic radical activating enzyme
MKISEVFSSIQGEGTHAGKPSVFLRTALCNLKCVWCDTKYTWDWDNYDYSKEVHELPIEKVIEKIKQFEPKHLVITGGEPLIQQNDIASLLSKLGDDYFVEVETDGTIIPNSAMLEHVNHWNVSPKTSNSGNSREAREIPQCYDFFAKLENSVFKFVIENETDLVEIDELITKYSIAKNKILLMPQASTKDELNLKKEEIEKIAKAKGLLFSSRLQVERWGNQRGT